jgi:hypothetical protein
MFWVNDEIRRVTCSSFDGYTVDLLHIQTESNCILRFVVREPVVRKPTTKVLIIIRTLENLLILTLLIMHERLFPFLELSGWEKYTEFEDWVESVSGVHLSDPNWKGTIEPLSYYYIAVRDFLRNYLFKMKNRRHQNWMLASSTLKTLD